MKEITFLSDRRLLIRQAFMAWLSVIVSVLVFVLLSLLLSLIIASRESVIIVTFLLILPALVIVHVYLQQSEFRFRKSSVNINIATVEELASISGIGNELARQIVEYRNKNGDFTSVEDLINVPDLKAKNLDLIISKTTNI